MPLPTDLVIDPALVRKYDISGPRYTSYPTADRFVEAFDEASCRNALSGRALRAGAQPLSLYVHVPFCRNVCFYCACNKEVTRDPAKAARYVDHLALEIAAVAAATAGDKRVAQMHWGGGTPTFLGAEQMARLCHVLEAHLPFPSDCERSFEMDPRDNPPGTLEMLAGLGFNRLSLGVQDFDPAVQEAVHRVQPAEMTQRAIDEARACGYRSVNFDLIYGLPRQRLESFAATLDAVVAMGPDRIALYGYAHMPDRFSAQRGIRDAELPSGEARLEILLHAIDGLTRAGYVYIGMDHFAKPGDDLAVALTQGRLHRNFQGYTAMPDGDIVGLGASSISRIGAAYSQNEKDVAQFERALDNGRLPVARGIELGEGDLVRRAVIQALMCQSCVSIESIETAYLVDFQVYFARELEDLREMQRDGLVEVDRDWITVTPRGRLLVRAICMVFDAYLREHRRRASYSRVL